MLTCDASTRAAGKRAPTRWAMPRWLLATASAALLLLLVAAPSVSVLGEGVDDRSLEPVAVTIQAAGIDASYFTSPTRNFLAEFRAGLVSFLGEDPVRLPVSDDTFPLSEMRRVTTDVPNITTWDFNIHFVTRAHKTYPYDVYRTLANYCARQMDGSCDPMGMLKGHSEGVPARRWLFVATAVNLRCCDDSLVATLQECPVCDARDWLPVILGAVFGFLGFVLLLVSAIVFCRRKKRKRTKNGISDAGRKPPPANIGPAFDVHKWQQQQQQQQAQQPPPLQWQHPQQQQQQWAQLQPTAPSRGMSGGDPSPPSGPPVVVKVASDGGKSKRPHRKDEPDASSSPIAEVTRVERDDRRKRNDKK